MLPFNLNYGDMVKVHWSILKRHPQSPVAKKLLPIPNVSSLRWLCAGEIPVQIGCDVFYILPCDIEYIVRRNLGFSCYLCGRYFEPEAQKLKTWAESGARFDPTDWECPDCVIR